jgi:hypothetical protein
VEGRWAKGETRPQFGIQFHLVGFVSMLHTRPVLSTRSTTYH